MIKHICLIIQKSSCLLAALSVFFSAFPVYAENKNVDIFQGTLVIYHDQPVLIRCDIVSNAYILIDKNGKTDSYLDLIKQSGADLETPVSAVVMGRYQKINGENHLQVQEITEIKRNSSCHLITPKRINVKE